MDRLNVWLPAIRAGSGSDVFTLRLAEGLERRGHAVSVKWFAHPFEMASKLLRLVSIPRGVDVIHANTGIGHAFAGRGVPCVVTEHQYIKHPAFLPWRSSSQIAYHKWIVWPAVNASLRMADAVVTVSKHVAEDLSHDIGRPVQVVHNWVDTDRFRPLDRGASTHTPLRLLFVGNPSKWKGADVIGALASRLGALIEVTCLGGLRKAFPAELANAPNIRILDRIGVEDMPAIYPAFDAALVPTRYEAFGYVALEAMACGLPVVGFDSTGTREVCENGESALLVAMDDIDALVTAITRLRDPDLRRTLGANGRQRAIARFGEADAMEGYEAIYRSVISRRLHHRFGDA